MVAGFREMIEQPAPGFPKSKTKVLSIKHHILIPG